MNGRSILITGASSGIGEALAREWARRLPGDRLQIAARTVPALERVRAGIHAISPRTEVEVLPLDLESPESIAEAARHLTTDGRLPDVVIHNAGLSQRSLASETALEVDRRLMEVNYFGTVGLTKQLLPAFLRRGHGHLVVVTSLVGKFGSPMRSGYAASKHALHGFFDSLRAELAQRHGPAAFPVTLVCPGFIRTHISENALTGDGTAQRKMDPSTGQGMAPEECARRIVDAIEAGKLEVTVGGRETAGVLVKRLAPSLFARLIQKAKVT